MPISQQELLRRLTANSSPLRSPVAYAEEQPSDAPLSYSDQAPTSPPVPNDEQSVDQPDEASIPGYAYPHVGNGNSEEARQLKALLNEQLKKQSDVVDLNRAQYEADARTRAASPQVDYSNLLRWVDQNNGTKYSEDYKPPQAQNGLQQLQAYTKAQNDLSGNQAAALKSMLANSADNRANQRADIQQSKSDELAHRQVVRAIQNDPILKERLRQSQNLSNSLALIQKSDTITPQQFNELQQAVRGNLGIKGTSGVGERELSYLSSFGIKGDAAKQFLTGQPVDIGKDNPLVKHLQKLAAVEQDNIKGQAISEIDAASGGFAHVYDRRPDLFSSLQKLVKQRGAAFSGSNQESQSVASQPRSGAVAGEKPKNTSGKRSYEDMSLDELKALDQSGNY